MEKFFAATVFLPAATILALWGDLNCPMGTKLQRVKEASAKKLKELVSIEHELPQP